MTVNQNENVIATVEENNLKKKERKRNRFFLKIFYRQSVRFAKVSCGLILGW